MYGFFFKTVLDQSQTVYQCFKKPTKVYMYNKSWILSCYTYCITFYVGANVCFEFSISNFALLFTTLIVFDALNDILQLNVLVFDLLPFL